MLHFDCPACRHPLACQDERSSPFVDCPSCRQRVPTPPQAVRGESNPFADLEDDPTAPPSDAQRFALDQDRDGTASTETPHRDDVLRVLPESVADEVDLLGEPSFWYRPERNNALLLAATSGVLVLALSYALFRSLSQSQEVLQLLAWGSGILVACGGLLLAYYLQKNCVVLFQRGLIHRRLMAVHVMYWPEVVGVRLHVYRPLVKQERVGPVAFLGEGDRTVHCWLRLRSGQEFHYTAKAEKIQRLCDVIQEETGALLVEEELKKLSEDIDLLYAPFTISRTHLRIDGQAPLPWNLVGNVEEGRGVGYVFTVNDEVWAEWDTGKMWNGHVFQRLVGKLRGSGLR